MQNKRMKIDMGYVLDREVYGSPVHGKQNNHYLTIKVKFSYSSKRGSKVPIDNFFSLWNNANSK